MVWRLDPLSAGSFQPLDSLTVDVSRATADSCVEPVDVDATTVLDG